MKNPLLAGILLILLCSQSLLRGQTDNNGKNIEVILPGDYPDPTILRDGDDFYTTHSSLNQYPGLLIWHSRDLKSWTRVTRALQKYVGDVWAPDLVKYQGKYYIYFPGLTKKGLRIFVVMADKMEGPWGDPVQIGDFPSIDPGHIATLEGKRYIHLDKGQVIELAADGYTPVGEVRNVYDGWPIPDEYGVECFCLESPKLLFHNNYFYLTSAEGGTAGPSTSHMVISARSESPLGPWENSPNNPIIHTWKSDDPWMSKGHGTIFEGPNKQWYMIYHAYRRADYNLGRHSLIEPIEWTEDKWYKSTLEENTSGQSIIQQNSRIVSDDFSKDMLNLQWSFIGNDSYMSAVIKGGKLIMSSDSETIKAVNAIVSDPDYIASVKLEPGSGVESGITAFYNSGAYVGLAFCNGKVFSVKSGIRSKEIDAPKTKYFRMKTENQDVRFEYSNDGKTWSSYPYAYQVSGYNHNNLGGFLSLKVGVYVKGSGNVIIDDFEYKVLK